MAREHSTPAAKHTTPTKSNAYKPPNRGEANAILQRQELTPRALRPADILHLQRSIGNRATGRLLQAKLKLGPAGDRYEQEADRVAKQVVQNSRQPAVQREEGEESSLPASPYASSISSLQRSSTPASSGFFVARPPKPKVQVQREEGDEGAIQASPYASSISTLQRSSTPATSGFFVARAPKPKVQVQREEGEKSPFLASPYASSMADYVRSDRPVAAGTSQAQRVFAARPLPAPKVQRDEMEEELQAAPNHGLEGGDVDAGVERTIQSAKGGGQPLHDGVRSSMEKSFGADFSGVNVHTDSESDALNRSLNAKAFTTGKDIFFSKGQYNPGSTSGQELIAHELTHTVQQGAAGVQRETQPQADPSRFDPTSQVAQRQVSTTVIQRAPNIERLKKEMGIGKYKKAAAEGLEAYFDTLPADKLNEYKTMGIQEFNTELAKIKKQQTPGQNSGVSSTDEKVEKFLEDHEMKFQGLDLLTTALVTGKDAAEIGEFMTSAATTVGEYGKVADTAGAGAAGLFGGIKDTWEGYKGYDKPDKPGSYATLASGVAGILSLVGPDFFGAAAAGSKTVAGAQKWYGAANSRNEIEMLRKERGADQIKDALDVLANKINERERDAKWQTGLGGMETIGAGFGTLGSWGASAISKSTDLARGTAKWWSGGSKAEQEKQKEEELKKMKDAVDKGDPKHIGRLYNIAKQVDEGCADAMDEAIAAQSTRRKDQIKDQIENAKKQAAKNGKKKP